MATKGAISINGVDVSKGHPLDGPPGSECLGIPESVCQFLSPPTAAIPYIEGNTGVFVDGYKMAASGMEFGAHQLKMASGAAGCDDASGGEDCSLDHGIDIPAVSCSLTVTIDGAGAALPGIEFSCSASFPDYKSEIEGGSVNVLIYV